MNDIKKESDLSYLHTDTNKDSSTPLTSKNYFSLLQQYGITKELYKHPVVISIFKQILKQNAKLSFEQMKLLLDNILIVSPVLNSFTIIFNNSDKANLFSYKLHGDDLIYTKQSFSGNRCTETTKYFNELGRCYYIDKSKHKVSRPKSYKTKDYEKEEGITL